MQTLRRFLRLIAPYWFNRYNRVAWALLAADTARALIAARTSSIWTKPPTSSTPPPPAVLCKH